MKNSLLDMHDELINKSMSELPGKLPISPKKDQLPIIVQNRWNTVNQKDGTKALTKKFEFGSMNDRNEFIRELLIYEEECQHSSKMIIVSNSVTLMTSTENVGVTERDKNFALYVDEIYKDVSFYGTLSTVDNNV